MLEGFHSDKFEYKRIPLEEQEKRQILGRLAGVIADTNSPTRNGRKYSKDLWEKVFNDPIMKEKIANRCVFAELGHPADREEVDMEKVCACLAEQPKISDDGKIYGVFDILNTNNGRILKTLCDYGTNIGVSSRGTGDLYTDENGEEAVDPETYNCECWDIVVVPAVESARLKYVTEALDQKRYNKTLKQKLNEQLESASEEDRKVMKESLKTLFDEAAYTKDELMDKFGTDDLDLINAGNEEDVTLADDIPPLDTGSDLVPNDVETITDPQPTETESLNEATHQYLSLDDIDFDTEPALYNAMDYDAISLIVYNGDVLTAEKIDTEALEDAGISMEDLRKDMETLAYSMGIKVKFDDHANVKEELESEDGWGDTVSGTLEPIFDDIEKMIYEVRNGRRGSYADFGSELSGLINKLDELSNSMQDAAGDLESQEDTINETNEELEFHSEDADYYQGQLAQIHDDVETLLHEIDQDPELKDSITYKNLMKIYDILDDQGQLMNETNEELEMDLDQKDAAYYEGELDKLRGSIVSLISEAEPVAGSDSYIVKTLKAMGNLLDGREDVITEAEEESGPKKFASVEEAKEYIASLPQGADISIDCNEDGSEWYVNEGFTNESCDDKELEECGPVDNVMEETGNELTEALLKIKQLEKDNLSLQEKLSVCNAKEVQLGEELKRYKASTASLSESAKKAKALDESMKSYTEELNKKDELIESLKNDASLVNELNEKVQKLEEELNLKIANVDQLNETLNRYRSSLKSTRELYLEALVNAYGLDIDEVRSRLTESYKNTDIKRVCDTLLQEKRNLSKLPFKLNKGVKLKAKSTKREVTRSNFYDDDNTESLLNLINNIK